MKPSGRTVTVTNVDGGPGAPSDASGSGETDLDAEQSGALAPDANVIVYQAPNTDPGFFDAFADAASQNTADTVSTSWGESEVVIKEPSRRVRRRRPTRPPSTRCSWRWRLRASRPSTPAVTRAPTTTTTSSAPPPVVDNPADSPYITASGGTTLPYTGTRVRARRDRHGERPGTPSASGVGTTRGRRSPRPTESRFRRSPRIRSWVSPGAAAASASIEPSRPTSGACREPVVHGVPYFQSTDVQDIGSGVFEPTAFAFDPEPADHPAATARGARCPMSPPNADPMSGYLLYEPSFAGIGQPTLAARLGRHELRRAAAKRLGGGDRLLRRPPRRPLEPVGLLSSRRSATRRSTRSTRPERATTTSTTQARPGPSTTRAPASAPLT